jgi:hypothetical protein
MTPGTQLFVLARLWAKFQENGVKPDWIFLILKSDFQPHFGRTGCGSMYRTPSRARSSYLTNAK